MSKAYFIDSENVGSDWVVLIETAAPDDDILVFYTAKSPYMSYKNLIVLKQSAREVSFIECCEGTNALDFQLCTELGYRVCLHPEQNYVIVSNDTGYDAIVNYWRKRHVYIRRVKGGALRDRGDKQSTETRRKQTEEAPAAEQAAASVTPAQEETQAAMPAAPAATAPVTAPADESAAPEAVPVTAENPDAEPASEYASKSAAESAQTEVAPETSDSAAAEAESVSEPEQPKKNRKRSPAPRRQTRARKSPAEQPQPEAGTAPAPVPDFPPVSEAVPEPEAISSPAAITVPAEADERARELLYIVGKNARQDLNETLKQTFGEEKGNIYYNAFKSQTAYTEFLSEHREMTLEEKLNTYCAIIFAENGRDMTMPDDFVDTALDAWRRKRNLNSFRSALQTKYGKEKSEHFYAIIKSHMKILDKIR